MVWLIGGMASRAPPAILELRPRFTCRGNGTVDCEVDPGAVVSGGRRAIREYQFALVPTAVRFPDRRQVDRRSSVSFRVGLGDQMHAAHVRVGCRQDAIVP